MIRKQVTKILLVLVASLMIMELIYLFTPHKMTTVLALNQQLNQCDVLVDQIKVHEIYSLEGAELAQLSKIMEETKVQFDGRYGRFIEWQGDRLYHLYFSTATAPCDVVLIDEGGSVLYKGMRFQILGDSRTEILSFLSNSHDALP